MDIHVSSEIIDSQVKLLEQSLQISKCIKEKYLKTLNEKEAALQKCAELENQLARMKTEKCIECDVLRNKLINEQKEKKLIKKGEKATLLKKIAEIVASLDDGNQMTNAQLLTQIVCGGLNDSSQSKDKREITLIDEANQKSTAHVLVNETIVEDSEESSNECDSKPRIPIIIPETEPTDPFPNNTRTSQRRCKNNISLKKSRNNTKELGLTSSNNMNHNNEEYVTDQQAKKLKLNPTFEHLQEGRSPNATSSSNKKHFSVKSNDRIETIEDDPSSSPSVFSETVVDHTAKSYERGSSEDLRNIRHPSNSKVSEDLPGATWKLKPSLAVSDGNAFNGKKLKQTTLFLARPEKKHDISLNQGFKGGLSSRNEKYIVQKDEEKDIILPSPERMLKTYINTKKETFETLEDPDVTIFQPAITSTCLPSAGAHNSSFDRLPERAPSPSFKYRRETVRKRDERMRLPGQQCADCAKYYEAAGLNETREVRERMNKCSRHRDKFDIQIHTPPGFWDPVIPITPDGSGD